jgi:hypothetical protein
MILLEMNGHEELTLVWHKVLLPQGVIFDFHLLPL